MKALVLKTSEVKASVGSNPTLSAKKNYQLVVAKLVILMYNKQVVLRSGTQAG